MRRPFPRGFARYGISTRTKDTPTSGEARTSRHAAGGRVHICFSMAQRMDLPVSIPSEEPAWKQRAVERSIQSAKVRAEQRVQRFLDAAQVIIGEKGSTDFTVQEVVDRSRQSLRSFYLHFDGKHELLLALFEEAMSQTADQLRAAADGHDDPLDRLKVAIQLLFELSRPDPGARRPLFTDFAPQLLISHPAEVRA